VYEPLAAFDRGRQLFWRRYVQEGRAVAPLEGAGRQFATVMEALGRDWKRLPELPDEAYVLETDDGMLICPWNLRVRVAEAALTARDGVPGVLADAFVPEAFAGLARGVIDDWRSGEQGYQRGGPRVHEQVATFGVPLRWFVFVDLSEREVSPSDVGVPPGQRILRYRTDMAKARRRANRAHSVLRRGLGDVGITTSVAETARWLEEFHGRSVVELDYGGLAGLLSDESLLADDSPGLVAAGLAAVGRGDAKAAAAVYEQLVERWRGVQLLERSN